MSIRWHVGIELVSLSRLLFRVGTFRFCVVLMIGCLPAKSLGVNIRLLGIRISARRFCLTFLGTQFVFLRLLPHVNGAPPISVTFALSCENGDHNHPNDHNDDHDNNRNHSA